MPVLPIAACGMTIVHQNWGNAAIFPAGHCNQPQVLEKKGLNDIVILQIEAYLHWARTRMSIATQIHGTSSNVGSDAKRQSQSFMAFDMLNSRVNSNRSHRLRAIYEKSHSQNDELTSRRSEVLCPAFACGSIMEDPLPSTELFVYHYRS